MGRFLAILLVVFAELLILVGVHTLLDLGAEDLAGFLVFTGILTFIAMLIMERIYGTLDAELR